MQQSTRELVEIWNCYQRADGDKSIIRTIELELAYRPVRERIACGYPK